MKERKPRPTPALDKAVKLVAELHASALSELGLFGGG